MTQPTTDLRLSSPLVDVAWLRARRGDPSLVLFDASWHLPAAGRDGAAEFLDAHIPGSQYFDFDRRIRDPHSTLPHMLPPPELFEREVRALGVRRDSVVVCYDGVGIFSSPRVWWMFRAMGHDAVVVLDGGLPAWRAAGGEVVGGPAAPAVPGDFVARPEPARVADLEHVRIALSDPHVRVVDARSAGRFSGRDPEPRPGLRGGHMPGAVNLPYGEVLDGGRFRSTDELASRIAAAAGNATSLVCSCGSGVSACVIALAAEVAGMRDVAVYDGSWTEWGGCADTPVMSHG
jgi:thiosulfate/3-mercaptopyruvate sulfurtransferase